MLGPIVKAVQASGFVLGDSASVADAAVAGQLHMIESALPGWVQANVPSLSLWERVGVRAK